MKITLAITLLAAMHTTGALPSIPTRPGYGEAAPYTVVQQFEGFEERLYPARVWATTSMEGEGVGDDVQKPAFDPLFASLFHSLDDYLKGANEQNIRLNMTKPISTLVQPLNSSSYLFTMGFFIPEDNQANPPEGGDDIMLENRPRMNIFTRQFSDYATNAVVAKETQELAALITAAGITDVDFTSYYVATYTPPVKPFNRINEIWYVRQA